MSESYWFNPETGELYEDIDLINYQKNNSGKGEEYVPEDVKGWNWGAFWFGPIWCLGNKLYNQAFIFTFTSFLLPFVFNVIIAAKGNEWAWKNAHWQSVNHFNDKQQKWTNASWLLLPLIIVASVAIAIFSVP